MKSVTKTRARLGYKRTSSYNVFTAIPNSYTYRWGENLKVIERGRQNNHTNLGITTHIFIPFLLKGDHSFTQVYTQEK